MKQRDTLQRRDNSRLINFRSPSSHTTSPATVCTALCTCHTFTSSSPATVLQGPFPALFGCWHLLWIGWVGDGSQFHLAAAASVSNDHRQSHLARPTISSLRQEESIPDILCSGGLWSARFLHAENFPHSLPYASWLLSVSNPCLCMYTSSHPIPTLVFSTLFFPPTTSDVQRHPSLDQVNACAHR